MTFNTEPAKVTARKAHRCCWCGQKIEAGSEYLRWVWIDGGDVTTCKAHPECEQAMDAAFAAGIDLSDGWVAGEFPRGCFCDPAGESHPVSHRCPRCGRGVR